MSRIAAALAALAVLSAAPAAPAQKMPPTLPRAEPDEESFAGDLDVLAFSQYVWRGREFNPDGVLQPNLRLNEKGLELGGQGTLDLNDAHGMKGNFSEWKLRGGLARKTAGSEIALTYNYYNRRSEDDKTQEIALELAWGNPFFLGLDVYWDVDAADGFYGRFSGGLGWKAGFLCLIPSVSVGAATDKYLDYYFGVDSNSFCDVQARLRAEAELAAGVALVAEGDYSELLTDDLRQARKALATGSRFWCGGGLSLRF